MLNNVCIFVYYIIAHWKKSWNIQVCNLIDEEILWRNDLAAIFLS